MTAALAVIARYYKAVAAAVLAGLTSAGTALLDGHITQAEWVTIAIAVVGTSGAVGIVTNAANPKKTPQDEALADHALVLNQHADDIAMLQAAVSAPTIFAGNGVAGYGSPAAFVTPTTSTTDPSPPNP